MPSSLPLTRGTPPAKQEPRHGSRSLMADVGAKRMKALVIRLSLLLLGSLGLLAQAESAHGGGISSAGSYASGDLALTCMFLDEGGINHCCIIDRKMMRSLNMAVGETKYEVKLVSVDQKREAAVVLVGTNSLVLRLPSSNDEVIRK